MTAAPREIRYRRDDRTLRLTFADGTEAELPAEFLRVHSPSAEVQGHSPSQRQTVPGRRHVGIMGIEPVGNYAVRIRFDDLHDTGIFTWTYLRELADGRERMWQDYLDALGAKGLSRDP
ncbi:MAG: DUF971 domain-containing protein [Acetobacterales bacterium]